MPKPKKRLAAPPKRKATKTKRERTPAKRGGSYSGEFSSIAGLRVLDDGSATDIVRFVNGTPGSWVIWGKVTVKPTGSKTISYGVSSKSGKRGTVTVALPDYSQAAFSKQLRRRNPFNLLAEFVSDLVQTRVTAKEIERVTLNAGPK